MAQPVYATAEEYGASPYGRATAPEDIDDRLAIASRDIDDLIVTAVYDVDDDGQPTDTDTAEALRDATIAQTSYGIDPAAGLAEGELPAGVSSASIGSASITRQKAAPEVRVGGIAYAPRVLQILRRQNLTNREPWTR
ncbi:hypothetical protein [Glycomyces arizonensis]|uniref:hypothetical protein n=1 Tax=Glycomyces arizonensis TaxID=256035 RepID=UPI000414FE54|nr:hypothetical protein [Glycomyces arizonensis]